MNQLELLPDAGNFPIVQTKYGPVRGRKCLDYDGNPYYSFVRVPYGVAPAGKERFTVPYKKDLKPWTDPMDCTFNIETDRPPPFSEKDCLYCNIYTPLIPNEKTYGHQLKPILVFIPGENATLSHRYQLEQYGPQYFMTESVVLVVVSYRSGILGFAKVQDEKLKEEVPGYCGLMDLSNFFDWLEDENEHFGGSDNSTTAFGQGSGASLILDSLYTTKNGFSGVEKVIMQSINGCSWLGPDEIDIKEYAMFAGWADAEDREKDVLLMLRNMSVETLVSFEERYLKRAKFRALSFQFMTRLRYCKRFGGQFHAVMIGFNSNEGIMDKVHFRRIDRDPTDIEKLLKFIWFPDNTYVSDPIRTVLIPKIEKYFYKDPPTREKYMEIISDLNHNIETLMLAREIPCTFKEATRVWLYRFDVDGQLNLVKRKKGALEYPGACFGDELGYLFKVPGFPAVQPGSLEDLTIRRMVKLYANFARRGTPNFNPRCPILGNTGWRTLGRITRENEVHVPRFCCLDIGKNLEFPNVVPEVSRLNFWCRLWKRLVLSHRS